MNKEQQQFMKRIDEVCKAHRKLANTRMRLPASMLIIDLNLTDEDTARSIILTLMDSKQAEWSFEGE